MSCSNKGAVKDAGIRVAGFSGHSRCRLGARELFRLWTDQVVALPEKPTTSKPALQQKMAYIYASVYLYVYIVPIDKLKRNTNTVSNNNKMQ